MLTVTALNVRSGSSGFGWTRGVVRFRILARIVRPDLQVARAKAEAEPLGVADVLAGQVLRQVICERQLAEAPERAVLVEPDVRARVHAALRHTGARRDTTGLALDRRGRIGYLLVRD